MYAELEIKQFGPIKECNLSIKQVTVFTGEQAAGKSTIAKLVYFFLSLRDVLWHGQINNYDGIEKRSKWYQNIDLELDKYFFRIFGECDLKPDLYIKYHYGSGEYIEIEQKSKYEIIVSLSPGIDHYLSKWSEENDNVFDNSDKWKENLDNLLDNSEYMYIPAGRSASSIFGKILSNFLLTMDKTQQDLIDFCNMKYFATIFKLAPSYEQGIDNFYLRRWNEFSDKEKDILYKAKLLSEKILRGSYRNWHGTEKIILSESGEMVDLVNASSGQQESVWIINLLIHYIMSPKPAVIILEEPESHLYPDAQQLITKLISLAGQDNQIVLTTHSPYVLGELNNMLYAARIGNMVGKEKINNIIPECYWLKFNLLKAYHIHNGGASECVDDEIELIENEVIDGASDAIRKEFDNILAIKMENLKDDAN